MSDQRQNNQYQLVFLLDEGSEASGSAAEGPKRSGRKEPPKARLATSR